MVIDTVAASRIPEDGYLEFTTGIVEKFCSQTAGHSLAAARSSVRPESWCVS